MPKSQTALILGAGFSCEARLPSTKQIVETFLSQQDGFNSQIENEISHQLKKFWQYVFHYDVVDGLPPSLEDHFTVIDLAANSGRNIGPEYTPRKLRAVRRFSIHRVFQILDQRYRESDAIKGLLASLQAKSVTVVSTNWDVVVEKHLRCLDTDYNYGLPVENLEGKKTEGKKKGIKLLMLHGSASWIYCDSCRRLYVEQPAGKMALHRQIYIESDDFRALCPNNPPVLDFMPGAKECVH